MQNTGLIASGLSPDGNLVEIVEVADHEFMVGVKFHPEFKSRPQTAHPLFSQFVDAARLFMPEGSQHTFPIETRRSSRA